MGRVGRESPQLVERGFEARERIVHDGRQPADFVRLIWNAQALMQTLGRNASSLCSEPINWDERPAREDVAADAGKNHHQR